jgi:hypothetical protein
MDYYTLILYITSGRGKRGRRGVLDPASLRNP